MKKSTKGALAGAAAGALLLGGAGSLAYWTDSVDVPGSTLTSGHFRLDDAPNCQGWTLHNGDAFNPGTDTIVPGETLTRVCTVGISAVGSHITGQFTAEAPTDSGDANLAAALGVTAAYSVDNGGGSGDGSAPLDIPAGDSTLTATITVTFDTAAGNNTEDVTDTLDAITISATQGHQA